MLIAMLMLPIALMHVVKVAAAESLATDRSIYVIEWGVDPNTGQVYPYVNITITMNGLVWNDLYQLDIYRWASAAVGYENKSVRTLWTVGLAIPVLITAIILLTPGTGEDVSYLAGKGRT